MFGDIAAATAQLVKCMDTLTANVIRLCDHVIHLTTEVKELKSEMQKMKETKYPGWGNTR